MNSRLTPKVVKRIAQVASALAVVGVLVAVSGTAATSMSACGESGACTNLRESTYADLEVWQACDPEGPIEQCMLLPGNSKDCTGVLACEFAINAKYRAEAEPRIYSIGEASQGCYLCATPNCITESIAYCEPISRRCLGVTALIDGGLAVSAPVVDSGTAPTPDAGVAPVVDAGDAGAGFAVTN